MLQKEFFSAFSEREIILFSLSNRVSSRARRAESNAKNHSFLKPRARKKTKSAPEGVKRQSVLSEQHISLRSWL
jgi:hypothetical protein